MDFAEARYYSAKQGRFTSPDTLLSSAESDDPQSWNRYSYVGNRPLIVTDPTGLRWAWKKSGDNYTIQYFENDAEAVREGWTIIHGAYTFTDTRGREITIYEDGRSRIFTPQRERQSVFRDTQLTNSMMLMLGMTYLYGGTLGFGAATGLSAITAESLLPLSAEIGATMGG